MPSKLIIRNTVPMARPSELSGKIPIPDSVARKSRITACTIAGRERSRAGSGGRPNEIEERERKTVA